MGFKVENHPPWGDCVVVPQSKFESAWETVLNDQGHPCVFTEIARKKLVLVRLMGEPLETAQPAEDTKVKEPKKSEKAAEAGQKRLARWTQPEIELLVKLTGLDKPISGRFVCDVESLRKGFPGRSEGSIQRKVDELAKLLKKKRKEETSPRVGPAGKPLEKVEPGHAEVSYSVVAVSTTVSPSSNVKLTLKRVFEEDGGTINTAKPITNSSISEEARVGAEMATAVIGELQKKMQYEEFSSLILSLKEYEQLGKPTILDVVTVTIEKRGEFLPPLRRN
jgi:hypothetical protein